MGLGRLVHIIMALALPSRVDAEVIQYRRKKGAQVPILLFEFLQKLELNRWFVKCRLALSELWVRILLAPSGARNVVPREACLVGDFHQIGTSLIIA